MAVTVQSQIDRLKRFSTDITVAIALEYLQYANRELCFDLPLYLTEEDITLTANTQEYAVNADDLRVWTAHYWTSATASRPLEGVSLQGLERRFRGWRNTPASIPSRYAVHNVLTVPYILLYPKPNTTTTGGYPFVRLRVSRHVALTQAGNLPATLVDPNVYTYKAAELYCIDHDMSSRLKDVQPALHASIRKNLQGLDFKVLDAPPQTLTHPFPGVSR